MKILILGAGQVGGTLAENLAREANDITLVDQDADHLQSLQQTLDIQTIVGHASHPDVLEQAGAEHADMIIAVTNSDETNMVACQIASVIFHTPMRIARVRSNAYLEHKELFGKPGFHIDICTSPERLVTNYIRRLIDFPGTLQVLDFADGLVQMVAVKPCAGGELVGKTIAELHQYIPEVALRVAAIYRHRQSLPITGSTVMDVGDEVFFIATPPDIRKLLAALGRDSQPYKRIFIAGGGHVGFNLAKALEGKCQVKLVEHNIKRSQYLAENLNHTLILQGDAADFDLLMNENIEQMDAFIAVTNDEEANIMSCLQAKRLGARQVMALINRTAYVDLVEEDMIDVAISPQQASISGILTLIRHGDMVNVHSLRRGAAEAIEVIAHGDQHTSRVVGRRIRDIRLPKGTVIGAIVRDKTPIIARSDTEIIAEDHVIVFVNNKKYVRDVEALFQVKMGFFE